MKRGFFIAAIMVFFLFPQNPLAGVKGTPKGKPRVKVGDVAPLETEELRRAHEEGKAILLMFGNPWHCIYCEKVWLNIKALLPNYEEGVTFILVSPLQVKWWKPSDEHIKLASRYGIIGEPWVFLIDREGIVRHIFIGFTEKGKIEAGLKKVLGGE